jgi:arginase family enzyme
MIAGSSNPSGVAVIGEFGLLGVPSSAAAHGPGQKKAPAALRRAGLSERLAAAGVPVVDYGDLPVVRWRPDRHQRRPHNLQAVLGVLRETTGRVGAILADGRIPLVLGGECSVTVDVIDFLDLPVADIPLHNAGLAFDEAMACLAVFARHEGLAGLTITEFNPDHGAEDGSTADALVHGLVGALGATGGR